MNTRFLLLVLLLSACTDVPPSATPVEPPPEPTLRIALLVDISGSSSSIPRPTGQDLDLLIQHIATLGGELSVTTVDASVPAFERLTVDPPRAPLLDVGSTNVFVVARQRAVLEELRADYEAALAAYRAEAAPRIQAFKDAVADMLAKKASQTFLHAALMRTSLYCAEPSPFPYTTTILLLLSDGVDTSSGSAPEDLDCDQILMVTADGSSIGSMEPFRDDITLFENPSAAISYLLEVQHANAP